MVANFESGGAAVSVLARLAGARVVVSTSGRHPTGNIAVEPALSREETEELVARGPRRGRATARGRRAHRRAGGDGNRQLDRRRRARCGADRR